MPFKLHYGEPAGDGGVDRVEMYVAMIHQVLSALSCALQHKLVVLLELGCGGGHDGLTHNPGGGSASWSPPQHASHTALGSQGGEQRPCLWGEKPCEEGCSVLVLQYHSRRATVSQFMSSSASTNRTATSGVVPGGFYFSSPGGLSGGGRSEEMGFTHPIYDPSTDKHTPLITS